MNYRAALELPRSPRIGGWECHRNALLPDGQLSLSVCGLRDNFITWFPDGKVQVGNWVAPSGACKEVFGRLFSEEGVDISALTPLTITFEIDRRSHRILRSEYLWLKEVPHG